MELTQVQTDLLEDLRAFRAGEISVSEARTRSLMARTLVEAEKVELVRQQMCASGEAKRAIALKPELRAVA